MDILVLIGIAILRIKKRIVPKVVVRIESAREVKWKGTLYQRCLSPLFHLADRFIIVSNSLHKDLVNNFTIPSEKITCIYNGVELTKQVTNYSERNFNYDLISIGRLVEAKNYPLLIEAIKILRDRNINLKACIVGGGPLEDMVKRLIAQYDLNNIVTLTGELLYSEAQSFLEKSRLFVLSSSWEGFGVVIIEAMAKGLPIISTDCDFGPAEILRSENNTYGKLVPVNDPEALANSISEILGNKEKMSKFSKLSLARVKDFDIKNIAHQHEELFNKLSKEV